MNRLYRYLDYLALPILFVVILVQNSYHALKNVWHNTCVEIKQANESSNRYHEKRKKK